MLYTVYFLGDGIDQQINFALYHVLIMCMHCKNKCYFDTQLCHLNLPKNNRYFLGHSIFYGTVKYNFLYTIALYNTV